MVIEIQLHAGGKRARGVKFPADVAKAAIREVLPVLRPCCLQDEAGKPWLCVAGSLRRRKAEVGDVELVYVPQFGAVQNGLFTESGNMFDAALEGLIVSGVLAMRRNAQGAFMWGRQNKFAVHIATGVPFDFFATTAPHFFNYLVCRTGGKDSNMRIATAAAERGLKWHPYHAGFEVVDCQRAGAVLGRDLSPGQVIPARTEAAVFEIAGLSYLEPWERA